MSDKPHGPLTFTRESGADVFPFLRHVTPRSNVTVHMPADGPMPKAPVVELADRRQGVWYDVAVCHHWDGTIETWTKGVEVGDPVNRHKVAEALRLAADRLDEPRDTDPEPT
jgi:hypothetical protein